MASPRKAALAFVLVTVLLDVLALGVVIPVLPQLVERFLNGDVRRAAQVFGAFVTAWEAMQFFFSPVLGALSDRFGRRPVILLSNVGLGLDYVLMALAPNLSWLFVGRLVSGITAASFPTAAAYIADVLPPEKRAGGFGMIGAAFGVGFVLGPALGGLLGQVDARLPFWVSAALSLANAAYGALVLPESLPRDQRTRVSWARANPVGSLRLLRSHRELLGLASVALLMDVAHFVFQSTFVLYADYRYGWKEREVGLALAAVGVCGAVVQGRLAGSLTASLGERRTMLVGLAFGVAGFVVYGLAPHGWVFALAIPVMSLWGIAHPASQALMSRRIGPGEQGQLQGALASLEAVAGMASPPMFTGVFAWAIAGRAAGAWPGAPFFVAAAWLIAAFVTAAAVTRAAGSREKPTALEA